MSDIAELKKLQAEARQLAKALDSIAKAKLAATTGVGDFAKAVAKLPPAETLAEAVADFQTRATASVGAVLRGRRDAFKRIEAEYVRSQQSEGRAIQEFDAGWRVGPVYLELRRESAEARALYNREVVIKWRPITAADDLAKLEKDALADLENWRLPEDRLVEAFHEAVVEVVRRRGKTNGSARNVPIREWLTEVRLVLARADLQGSKFDRKLRYAEFPTHGMLYNVDQYRARGSSIPQDRRVGFETGSQAEQSRNLGVVTNGLRPNDPYKVYCYAIAPAGSPAS
jgi:hypothetical protein